ncbi:hypothetical protein M427DRAFT_188433 [Gonapodya prolifera JEL478]|uniref:Uncharacterized protein n=1 Tax=Gonapodya prolifera (strain JEL478) TaxID=1344416 RepID=A0A139A072_GONPJ|nr:hypothetical protein M427DRAFT_188433 [Gonapodya prolifera JEL478]|eukprot:KXS10132.1 hypothetical protein M427DRAFT_188433 [Gonapodya prolifera JEL478]
MESELRKTTADNMAKQREHEKLISRSNLYGEQRQAELEDMQRNSCEQLNEAGRERIEIAESWEKERDATLERYSRAISSLDGKIEYLQSECNQAERECACWKLEAEKLRALLSESHQRDGSTTKVEEVTTPKSQANIQTEEEIRIRLERIQSVISTKNDASSLGDLPKRELRVLQEYDDLVVSLVHTVEALMERINVLTTTNVGIGARKSSVAKRVRWDSKIVNEE